MTRARDDQIIGALQKAERLLQQGQPVAAMRQIGRAKQMLGGDRRLVAARQTSGAPLQAAHNWPESCRRAPRKGQPRLLTVADAREEGLRQCVLCEALGPWPENDDPWALDF